MIRYRPSRPVAANPPSSGSALLATTHAPRAGAPVPRIVILPAMDPPLGSASVMFLVACPARTETKDLYLSLARFPPVQF
jgi:hypothetical protein